MGFESLLGNERLKQNLSAAVNRGRISHFYLICGPKGSGKHTLATLLAQGLMCRAQHKPCGVCGDCRKIAANTHPDFITVEDKDKKTVPVGLVRDARESMFIRPNEGIRKIYLFPQELRLEGQNALLKILEEPPAYGVFILLSENPEQLSATVRSRATQLRLTAAEPALLQPWLAERFPQATPQQLQSAIGRSGGYPGQAMALLSGAEPQLPEAEALLQALCARDTLALLQALLPMEKMSRDQAIAIFTACKQTLQEALACRSGVSALSQLSRQLATARSSRDLLSAIEALQKAVEYAQGNVSVAAICGWLTHAFR